MFRFRCICGAKIVHATPELKDSEERLPIRPLESGASTADLWVVGFGGAFGRPAAGRRRAERRVKCVLLIGPALDVVLKFKMLVPQSLRGLSLEATEHMVRDRLSWLHFCGLKPHRTAVQRPRGPRRTTGVS